LSNDKPEFDKEFYDHQVALMEERYIVIFSKANLPWKTYYKYIQSKLQNNLYWIWMFLCGLENFIKSQDFNTKNKSYLKDNLQKDAERRIARIIGDTNKIRNYIESL
jgi:hypothetical protein